MGRRLGFRSLVMIMILTGLSHPVAAGQAGRPVIVVELFDHAALSAETVTQAKGEVSRTYGDVGVEVLWTDATNAQGRFVVHLIIRPTPPRPRMMGHALGDSHDTGGTAFVYRDRVLDVARARHLDVARVLGYAMAHEMGHLLLPYPSHAITGIMQADWDGADFERMRSGSLRFTPAQASAIRAKASASDAAAIAAGGTADSRFPDP